MISFEDEIKEGIPQYLPQIEQFDTTINRAPKRKDILTLSEKKLAVTNALRYFDKSIHNTLAQEFIEELNTYGRIYMFRYKPKHAIFARPIAMYPNKCKHASAIMLMIQNNLDNAVAQHPYELITYGGNGAVFQNWAQYRLVMKYLSEMTNEQTLVMYSGHPLGLFPSNTYAPRVVVTNGLMIPNYSKPDDWEKYNALGVTQYGQMTAGSYMYIGPQGIVHGTTITVLNAARNLIKKNGGTLKGQLFVTSGLGGMSGAQPKAAVIAGLVCLVAEVNSKALQTRHTQGWVDEIFDDVNLAIDRALKAIDTKQAISIAYNGNIVTLWEALVARDVAVNIGSDQSSLHNPFAGGYYPVDISLDESNEMMRNKPNQFKEEVYKTLVRHVNAINTLVEKKDMYFFDYGNAFLLEASRAGAKVLNSKGEFKYPSYVQDILGPMCFDYGFGPFRWVCASGNEKDLAITDAIALKVLEAIKKTAPKEIEQQLADNILWIKQAQENKLVVGSMARILYADAEGRMRIAQAFNEAIATGEISDCIILGRDHHDVSGTDSPYRETSNIYDGSKFTADMAVQNFVGDAFRGATWVSLHNGGGVGWGEVINGGFGLVLDGSKEAETKLLSMLHWDVNNGVSRRAWARNKEALFAIEREMGRTPLLQVTMPNMVEDKLLNDLFKKL